MKKRFVGLSMALAVAMAVVGCGGNGDDGGSGVGQGTLAVRVADGLDPDVTKLEVVISHVEANTGNGWVEIEDTAHVFDLLSLTDNDTEIGSAQLPVGTYHQIRLFVDGATVTDADGPHEVEIPSADQTGIKINIPNGYTVEEGVVTTILLDFNVDSSLHKTGNGQYILRPTIKGVVKVLSGTITGTVVNNAGAVHGALVEAFADDAEMAVAEPENSTFTNDVGHFKLWALLAGTYDLRVTYTPTEGPVQSVIVPNVEVFADQNKELGTIDLQP